MAGAAGSTWGIFIILFTSDYPPSRTKESLGLINAMGPIGQLLATITGGIVAGLFSQRATFLTSAAGGFLCFILALSIHDPQYSNKSNRFSLKEMRLISKNRLLLATSALAIPLQFVTQATVFGFTPIAAVNLGANNFELGALTTLSIFPGIFASIMCNSKIVTKIGEWRTIMFGFLIAALTSIVVPYTPTIPLLIFTQFIAGFSRMLALTLLLAVSLNSVTANSRGTAVSVFQALYGIGMFMGPFAVGLISENVGLTWGFWMVGLVSVIGAFATLLLNSFFISVDDRKIQF